MKRLLFFYILVFLWVLPAKTTLSVALFPEQKTSVISIFQQSQTCTWDGQLTFAALLDPVIALPSRFKIDYGDISFSLGYVGFWKEYALVPFLAREQALFYQKKKNALVLLPGTVKKRAIGYERTVTGGKLSALMWMQPREEASSFQTEWETNHSWWGVVGKVLLKSQSFEFHAELLFTPVRGVDAFVSSSLTYAACTVGFAYGEAPYPSRYSLSLAVQSTSVRATCKLEDWFGLQPIYGGFSASRKRKQSGVLRISLGKGYFLLSFSDSYEFKPWGKEMGSVTVEAKWGGSFGQIAVHYVKDRGPLVRKEGEYKLMLVLYKVSLSYTIEGYEITLTDSVALEKGTCTWKLQKSMGKTLSFSLLYALTSDR